MGRRSLAVAAVLAGLLVVWLPAVSLVTRAVSSVDPPTFQTTALNDPLVLSMRTLLWSLGVASGALLLGWLPGRMLGGAIQSARAGYGGPRSWHVHLLLVLFLLPLLVPSYAVFYAWWQTWPSGSWLFGWLESIDSIGVGRQVTLGIALISWSWPLVALCVAPAAATWPRARTDQLRSDGATWWQSMLARWHHEKGGLLLGFLLVAVLVFGNIISFDLAGVFTVGNELRALAAVNAPISAMVWLIVPAAIVAGMGGIVSWRALGRPVDDATPGDGRLGLGIVLFVSCCWIVTTLLPNLLVFINLEGGFSRLWQGHGPALMRDAIRCLLLGLLVTVIFLGLTALLRARGGFTSSLLSIWSILWIICFLVPGSMVAAAVLSAIDMCPGADVRSWLLRSGAALQIAWLAKYGGLAVLGARWIVGSEPTALREVSSMHQDGWLADGPRTWLVAIGIGLLSMLLAMGEIPISMRLSPPSISPPVSVTLLNAMHYQRPDTVIAVLGLLLLSGWIVAIGLTIISRLLSRLRMHSVLGVLMLLIPLLAVPGCSEPASQVERLDVSSVVGGPGRSDGSFDYPRAMAVDRRSGDIYTIEKSGRVQRLDSTGRPLGSWQMPRIERGRPTGISVAPDGTVWVADTHEHRIMIYEPDGTWLRSFGEYGFDEGQFIYPTDVAFDADGLVYVSEYGGNDRIQVFNSNGTCIRQIGGPGSSSGRFDRPQSMVMSPDGGSLFVADTRNRRIQRVDLESLDVEVVHQGGVGQIIQVPFGISMTPSGDLLVSDTGSHLVVRLGVSGDVLDHGGGWGWDEGQLRDPWAVEFFDGTILALDSGNNRIQKIIHHKDSR